MNARTALAATLGMDSKEVGEYRYHYGQTKRPLYCVEDSYFTTGNNTPLDSEFNGFSYDWHPYQDQFFAKQARTTIWEARATI